MAYPSSALTSKVDVVERPSHRPLLTAYSTLFSLLDAMSKAASSPTARLLQASRLFSLPRPLPPPPLESQSSSGLFRASDTATTPYPTHQAITTPQSSLSRGDFGLKRALPAKTTRNTSTPHVRIKAQDTYEHITEFASAADHTQTRAKWLEMGIPIRKAAAARYQDTQKPESVFEDHLDNTDPTALRPRPRQQQGKNAEPERPRQRWKYTAPHIGAMPPGEFQKWLDSEITTTTTTQWREFLRQYVLRQRLLEARKRARSEGIPLTADQIPALGKMLTPSDKELENEEKRLRDNHKLDKLSSELSRLLTEFLDLPVLGAQAYIPAQTDALRSAVSDLQDTAPPTTHPSAGLSHLRTNAIMDNHPIYGPQRHRAPVEARVLEARDRAVGKQVHEARLGIGGFVAKDPITSTGPGQKGSADDMSWHLNPELEGGNKMWVHPEYATVRDKGGVELVLGRADREPIAIKTKNADAIRGIFETKRSSPLGSWSGSDVKRSPTANAQPFNFGGEVKDERDMIQRLFDETNSPPQT